MRGSADHPAPVLGVLDEGDVVGVVPSGGDRLDTDRVQAGHGSAGEGGEVERRTRHPDEVGAPAAGRSASAPAASPPAVAPGGPGRLRSRVPATMVTRVHAPRSDSDLTLARSTSTAGPSAARTPTCSTGSLDPVDPGPRRPRRTGAGLGDDEPDPRPARPPPGPRTPTVGSTSVTMGRRGLPRRARRTRRHSRWPGRWRGLSGGGRPMLGAGDAGSSPPRWRWRTGTRPRPLPAVRDAHRGRARPGGCGCCPRDGSEHYPRTDPAVIMSVVDAADRLLLARSSGWPEGRFSVLAGFVEPGETLAAAVAREVREEVGVEVDDVTYLGDQPWPFPASLMLGFTARATATDLVLPGRARSPRPTGSPGRSCGRRVAAGGWGIAGRLSIARRLIERWYGWDQAARLTCVAAGGRPGGRAPRDGGVRGRRAVGEEHRRHRPVAAVDLHDEVARSRVRLDVDLGEVDALACHLGLQPHAVAAPVVVNIVTVPAAGVGRSSQVASGIGSGSSRCAWQVTC